MRYVKIINLLIFGALMFQCDSDSSSDSAAVGQGGSMTRFAINNDYMYVVDNSTIQVFNVAGNTFSPVNEVGVGFGLETIFAKGEYLYLGANDAMYIYSIANPVLPKFIFRYSHIVSCDPVVVQGNRAYVTLRSGNMCNQGANALEIIDISDPYSPRLIKNYPMQSPHGLGVDGNYLFICEGQFGLKMYDISNEQNIVLLKRIQNIFAYDVIARNNLLTLTGEDGIFQYQYATEGQALTLLSSIPVIRAEN